MQVLGQDGKEANPLELGRLVVKLPLPPGTMTTLYKGDERFVSTYFTQYPVGMFF